MLLSSIFKLNVIRSIKMNNNMITFLYAYKFQNIDSFECNLEEKVNQFDKYEIEFALTNDKLFINKQAIPFKFSFQQNDDRFNPEIYVEKKYSDLITENVAEIHTFSNVLFSFYRFFENPQFNINYIFKFKKVHSTGNDYKIEYDPFVILISDCLIVGYTLHKYNKLGKEIDIEYENIDSLMREKQIIQENDRLFIPRFYFSDTFARIVLEICELIPSNTQEINDKFLVDNSVRYSSCLILDKTCNNYQYILKKIYQSQKIQNNLMDISLTKSFQYYASELCGIVLLKKHESNFETIYAETLLLELFKIYVYSSLSHIIGFNEDIDKLTERYFSIQRLILNNRFTWIGFKVVQNIKEHNLYNNFIETIELKKQNLSFEFDKKEFELDKRKEKSQNTLNFIMCIFAYLSGISCIGLFADGLNMTQSILLIAITLLFLIGIYMVYHRMQNPKH